jgi:hypothetical protein
MRAEATARVDGRTVVVGTGRVRDHRLVLTYRHLQRGRYRLTLVALGSHHERELLGHSSLVIS